ncbi:DUF6130 family protein [Nostoc sp. DedQUE09]|uniref:DUF6130 family protein n=1 Tax=Nostoc sp. DedQUE09 TaxID=3075394 RepID=UPI002AD2CC68|nr:DUF6130 family protein [Nostoc sp. DedQUE09]MDZ7954797.1 DUF6130 family protein [Nostoc sp. DedQUE09]
MSEKINPLRRRFLGIAAMSIAATQLGRFGSAIAQSSQTQPKETATTQPGTVQSTDPNASRPFTRSARDIRGASPYLPIKNEPAPKLIVDPPIPEGLAQGIFWTQYRVENLRIVPVFGAGAIQTSPRVGHLHITVDDLPWWWADASDTNTIDIAGLPPGQHKVKIELVDPNHKVFPGQVVTLTFTVLNYKRAHAH